MRILLVLVCVIGLGACDGASGSVEDPDMVPAEDLGEIDSEPDLDVASDLMEDIPPIGPPPRVSENFKVRESIEQIQIWGYIPEEMMEAVDADGVRIAAGEADYQGSLVLRDVPPGVGYSVRPVDDPEDYTGPFVVLSMDQSLPDEEFYASQVLEPGNGYLYTRDGTPLSIFVSMPGPPEEGPYPTVVNYSGYSPSRPGASLGGAAEGFCGILPVLCNAPGAPAALIAGVLGYASVGVNMRGTGCSGGAYDYFEPLQLTDGYDVVEIVAHQDWVKHHHVGMVGLSFPGIAQLFTAKTKPPSLAAIAPMSVIGNTTTTLVPGGIYNIGFAIEWIKMVLNGADPNAHGWVNKLIEEGDTVCEENQLLHSQKLNVVQKAYDNPYYTDEVAKPLDPHEFVPEIEVPVFLTGQLHDEQTGPHFPILFDNFTGAPVRRFTMTNGVHPDAFAPQTLVEWFYFLSFYVDREIPRIPADFSFFVPMFMLDVFGSPIELPEARFDEFTDFDEALAAYEAEPEIRVIFESGANPDLPPGSPDGTFDEHFDAWPIPGTQVSRWYFHPDGSLSAAPPGPDDGASMWQHEAEAGDRVSLASGPVDALQPDWNWRRPAEGMASSFVSEPLAEDMVFIGHGSFDLWLRTEVEDADIEVALIEVRPDGMESHVQAGWLRASHRTSMDSSTELQPVVSHYEEDVHPLIPGEWTLVRVELMPVSHLFRAGSRIRVVIDTPGDCMASWRFLLLEYEVPPVHELGHNAVYPSSVALPLVPGIEIPTELPPCHALRGQPCREYIPYDNTPSML